MFTTPSSARRTLLCAFATAVSVVWIVTTPSLALAANATAAVVADAVSLHPDYAAGQTARFNFTSKRSETTSLSQSPQTVSRTIKQQGTFEMSVVEASESGTTIALKLVELKSTLEDSKATLTFDSKSAPDDSDSRNPLLKALRPIVGSTITLKFDQKGRAVECVTDAELVTQGQFTEFARQLVGEEWAKFRWAPVLFPKPERGDAKVGDVWPVDQSLDVQMMGKLQTNTQLRLESVSNGVAKLKGQGEFTLEPLKDSAKSVLKPESFVPTLDMEYRVGTGTTKAEFDEKFKMVGDAQGLSFSRASDTQFAISRAE